MEYRSESDALGEKKIPQEAYYGIQTLRAHENFAVSGDVCANYREYIQALGFIKKAAAHANCQIGGLDRSFCDVISQASDEVIAGLHDREFIIDVFQGGGGTSTNMNANEVIANRANELLHGDKTGPVNPNNHVNMGQSTNDVIPAAIKMGIYHAMGGLLETVALIVDVLREKEDTYRDTVKLGRTCLQDALPLTVGQEFSGYRCLLERQKEKLLAVRQKCLLLPLGGTAVGSGMSALKGYHEAVFEQLRALTGVAYVQEENLFDGLQNGDIYVDISAALKSLATGLSKIATDLRILSSGPRAGLGEINLPAVQPGSSIMPGKINPVMPELINQICYQICGNDVAVTMAAEGGELDLNVWEPIFIKNIFESINLLKNGGKLFAEKCLSGITVNAPLCRHYAANGLALSTVISVLYDYKTGGRVAQKAFQDGTTIAQAAAAMGLMTDEEAAVMTDPLMLSDRNRSGELFLNAIAHKK